MKLVIGSLLLMSTLVDCAAQNTKKCIGENISKDKVQTKALFDVKTPKNTLVAIHRGKDDWCLAKFVQTMPGSWVIVKTKPYVSEPVDLRDVKNLRPE